MTPAALHPCFIPGCGKLISTNLLMCYPHWKRVPHDLKREVYAVWNQYQAGEIGLDTLRAVQQKATDAVEGGAV